MKNNIIISYLTQRKLIGILGIAMGFICILGGLLSFGTVLPSISAYYNSSLGDVFVAVLAMTGVFLLTYKGYSLLDNIVASIAGASLILVALIPTKTGAEQALIGLLQLAPSTSQIFHLISAGIFFTSMAVMSLVLFTKTDTIAISAEKIKRNKVYRICGIIIASALAILFATSVFIPIDIQHKFAITLILETIMLIAFGTSWLVKGEAILKDQ